MEHIYYIVLKFIDIEFWERERERDVTNVAEQKGKGKSILIKIWCDTSPCKRVNKIHLFVCFFFNSSRFLSCHRLIGQCSKWQTTSVSQISNNIYFDYKSLWKSKNKKKKLFRWILNFKQKAWVTVSGFFYGYLKHSSVNKI